ncbi:glucose/arabinose dehydrogenase [Haloactinospora alba]|uniref:Glucose/arabinose dehydrogenase n=1 Tax=Haloactinospora alba TaxID=405555 RepID=A0A543NL15_9ACTN|nr:PQQ-dependent sugar dehydrogenase [Haloactinospora alba]TQN32555.1 glucose/arabinose dehydrogenase [Haloactinospora alba]
MRAILRPTPAAREPRRSRSARPVALAAALALAVTSACGNGAPSDEGTGPGENDRTGSPPGEPSAVASDLEVPWGMDFLPDGSALVTERDSGRVLRVTPEGDTREVGAVTDAEARGEGGLLGLAVPRDAGERPYVYVYYTTGSDNRITRMRYDPDDGLGDEEVLVDGIPSASFHNGGRLAFGPDGMLYATTGDAGEGQRAQNPDSLGGKILRMTPEGEPADGNPGGDLVHSQGHRNVQGLAWDDQDRLFASEFGQDTWDEINLVEPGNNYGWPEVEGTGGGGDYTDPLLTWTPEEASPSGAAIAGGSLWVAALRGQRLWEVPITGDGGDPLGEPREHYATEFGRLRTVDAVPDGEGLWLTTSNRDGRGQPEENDDRILTVPLQE